MEPSAQQPPPTKVVAQQTTNVSSSGLLAEASKPVKNEETSTALPASSGPTVSQVAKLPLPQPSTSAPLATTPRPALPVNVKADSSVIGTHRPGATYARTGAAPYDIAAGKGTIPVKTTSAIVGGRPTTIPSGAKALLAANYARTQGNTVQRPSAPQNPATTTGPNGSATGQTQARGPNLPGPLANSPQPKIGGILVGQNAVKTQGAPVSQAQQQIRPGTGAVRPPSLNGASPASRPFILTPSTVSQRTLEIQARAAAAGSQASLFIDLTDHRWEPI